MGTLHGQTGLGARQPGGWPIEPGGERHAVLLQVPVTPGAAVGAYASLRDLERAIRDALAGEGGGGLDETLGAEGPEATIVLTGPDASALYRVVAPVVNEKVPPGSVATLRRGGPGAAEERVEIPAHS